MKHNKESTPFDEDACFGIFAEEIRKEIDKEIVEELTATTLVKKGWTKTFIPLGKYDWPLENRQAEIAAWIHLNATGDYKRLHGQWYFENARDATAFALVWA